MALSSSDAAHLLRRSGFGATPDAIQGLVGLGNRTAAVNRVLDLSRNPTPGAPFDGGKQLNEAFALENARDWWLARMIDVPSPIVEKMTLFWHGHFATEQRKVDDMGLVFKQNALYRSKALGRFGDLAQAASIHPAMLLYLDNWSNNRWEPQENFGREVLELFTLGSGSFTESDVVAMTRAWTGHGLAADHRTYKYRPADHDGSDKTLFGITKKWNGPAAVNEVLFGARAGESSRFITAKLFSFLAYPVTPQDAVVARLADGFRAKGLNVGSLVRSIFLSDEFWSPKARRALVRSPIEWFVAAHQATGLSRQGNPDDFMVASGQELFNPPNVAGWRGGRSWISSAGAAARLEVARTLTKRMDDNAVLGGKAEPSSAVQLVDAALHQFGITEPSLATRSALVSWVGEARKRSGDKVTPRLATLLLCSPDFQLA